MRRRAQRLLSKQALSGWGLLALFAWNVLDQVDTALAIPNVVGPIWNFVTTPQGNLIILALGLGWLGVLVWQPQFLRSLTGPNKPTVEVLDLRVSAIESTAERMGQHEDRLGTHQHRLGLVEKKVDHVWRETQPQTPAFNADTEKSKIIITYARMVWDPGGIDRTMTFAFDVHNASSLWILPTLETDGFLAFETEMLRSIAWQVLWYPSFELEPNGKARLDVVVSISERFAESLAYKPKGGSFNVDFSDMLVEFTGRDRAGSRQSLGYVRLAEKQSVRCDDHIAFQSIRAFVNWREGLPNDERMPH